MRELRSETKFGPLGKCDIQYEKFRQSYPNGEHFTNAFKYNEEYLLLFKLMYNYRFGV